MSDAIIIASAVAGFITFASGLGWALNGFAGSDYFTREKRLERAHRRLVLDRAAPLVALGAHPRSAIEYAEAELHREVQEVLKS